MFVLDYESFTSSHSFWFYSSEASTPEEMREEKKDQEGEKATSSEESKAAKVKASKPLMPTSTILRLLAELVRSYVGIATLIASYCYTAGQSELIKEVGGCNLSVCFLLFGVFPLTIEWCLITPPGLQCFSLCA